MNLSRVLRRPIVTEKSTLLQEQGKYVFEIHPQATKKDVSRAVESFFDVHFSLFSLISILPCSMLIKIPMPCDRAYR